MIWTLGNSISDWPTTVANQGNEASKKKYVDGSFTHLRCIARIVLFSSNAPAKLVKPYIKY